MKNILIILVIMFATTGYVSAHSGRTDGSGGHNCSAKSKRKGLCSGYHYHSRVDQKQEAPLTHDHSFQQMDESKKQQHRQQQVLNHGAGGCTPNFSTGGCL